MPWLGMGLNFRLRSLSCRIVLPCEDDFVVEPVRNDRETCLKHSVMEVLLSLSKNFLRRGRSVARHAATILAPASIVDQMAILTAFQKKSSVCVSPSIYRNRMTEHMQPLDYISRSGKLTVLMTDSAAKHRINPTDIFVLRSMFAFHRTKNVSSTNTVSVRVFNAAA